MDRFSEPRALSHHGLRLFSRKFVLFLAFAFSPILTACGDTPPDSSETKATPPARHAIGKAEPISIDALSSEELQTLRTDVLAGRRYGWNLFEKVLQPVDRQVGDATFTMPTFLTWYTASDIKRMFNQLYAELGVAGRRVRADFGDDFWPAIEQWNVDMLLDLSHWTPELFENWFLQRETPAQRNGLAGIERVFYSAGAAADILANYFPVSTCEEQSEASDPTADIEPLCLGQEFSHQAVIVKAAWQRRSPQTPMPKFSTNASALTAMLDGETLEWTSDGTAEPDDSEIFSVELPGEAVFMLTGLHVMSKASADWVWASMWWSADPESDFGEDRPTSTTLTNPSEDSNTCSNDPVEDHPVETSAVFSDVWANYNMCTAYDFAERTVHADHPNLSTDYPSLSAALIAAQSRTDGGTWCSNPYLERGHGNGATNCIGCHQHAGRDLTAEDMLADESLFPGKTRDKTRANFPADYVWSLADGPQSPANWFFRKIQEYDIYDALEPPTP